MRAYLRRRFDMLRAVVAHFDEHPDLWESRPPLVRTLAPVRAAAEELRRAAEAQATADPTGLTAGKQAARDRATALLHPLALKATALALETDDEELLRAVDRSRSDWERLPEATFAAEADDALDRIEARLPDLAEFDVSADDLAAARAALDAFVPAAARRDNVRADRGAATDDMDEAYTAVVPALKRLDRLVPTLVPDEAFVAEYARVRRITGD